MHTIWTIAKREFNHYFVSPVAYAVSLAFLGVLGLIFYASLAEAALRALSPTYVQWVISPFVTLMLFLTPAITMRLMAEEQRSGTLELLLTAPVQEWALVLGKWLAAFAFVSLIILLTFVYVAITNSYTRPNLDTGAILVAYIGLFLLVGAMLAVGVFVSTLFANQMAAFFATMAILLGLWLIGLPFQNDTGTLGLVTGYLDISRQYYENFPNGVIDLGNVVYFLSITAFFLFLAARVVESRRWR